MQKQQLDMKERDLLIKFKQERCESLVNSTRLNPNILLKKEKLLKFRMMKQFLSI